MLVDPVAGDAADRAPVPPGALAHLLDPGVGDVPVVGHVVVVPEHRGRDVGEEPADQRLAPALLVEPGVLLEVGDLLARAACRCRGARGSSRASAARPRRHRPGRRAGRGGRAGAASSRAISWASTQSASNSWPVSSSSFGQRVGLLVREGDPAGAEGDVQRALAAERAERGRRQLGVGLAASAARRRADLVGVLGARLEPFDPDQRVVVALDPEGRLGRAEHRDLAGPIGLDPDRRLGLGDVAQQRAEDQMGHPRQHSQSDGGRNVGGVPGGPFTHGLEVRSGSPRHPVRRTARSRSGGRARRR